MNAQTDRDIQVLRSDPQFDRYLVALCSLMLMVVLFVGAAGYAGIQGLLSSTTTLAERQSTFTLALETAGGIAESDPLY